MDTEASEVQASGHDYPTRDIVNCYESALVRAYCRIRFGILNQRFLREIGQYLPADSRVLDIGCGFGLFALTFARSRKNVFIHGMDLNAGRIALASNAAKKLGLANVRFDQGDATTYVFESGFDAAYMLDIVHHIPPEFVEPLLRQVYAKLAGPGSRLIIKDINDRPAYKRWFTWWLDKAMDYKTPVHYWPRKELLALLERIGFKVYVHEMVDYLPYPHIIYICTK